MRKITLFLALSLMLYVFSASSVEASFLTVQKDGQVIWNVLSDEDSQVLEIPQRESLSVKEVALEDAGGANQKISLLKMGDKFQLNVASDEGEKNLDVTNLKGSLIEIEERPTVKNLKIGLIDNRFFLQEGEILALTDFPINIDPTKAELSVVTQSGNHFLTVLPKEAYEDILRTKIINALRSSEIQIQEKSAGQISYEISGEKILNIFNLVKYKVPVNVSVSAITGEILNIDEPSWLKILSFMFS